MEMYVMHTKLFVSLLQDFAQNNLFSVCKMPQEVETEKPV